MKLSELNDWLTLLANLGVLVGLIVVAYEINLGRQAILADIYQNRAAMRSDSHIAGAIDFPGYHELQVRFQNDVSERGPIAAVAALSEVERYVLGQWHSGIMYRIDNTAFQYQQGFISEAHFDQIREEVWSLYPIWEALGLRIPATVREVMEGAGNGEQAAVDG